MATRRKRTGSAPRVNWIRPAVAALVLCGAIGAASLGYIWQKKQNNEVYDRIGEKEKTLRALQEEHDELARERDHLLLPSELDARVTTLQLGLELPDPSQVIQLEEPEFIERSLNTPPLYVGSDGKVEDLAAKTDNDEESD